MPRPSETACLRATFATNGACYKNLDMHRRKAAMVYLKALELAALGGTDYTADLGNDSELIGDVACYEPLELGAWIVSVPYLVIQAEAADAAGATVPASIQDVAAAIACLQNNPDSVLHNMDLLLTCLLGRHAQYNQVDL